MSRKLHAIRVATDFAEAAVDAQEAAVGADLRQADSCLFNMTRNNASCSGSGGAESEDAEATFPVPPDEDSLVVSATPSCCVHRSDSPAS